MLFVLMKSLCFRDACGTEMVLAPRLVLLACIALKIRISFRSIKVRYYILRSPEKLDKCTTLGPQSLMVIILWSQEMAALYV